jgi:hypothetical protein
MGCGAASMLRSWRRFVQTSGGGQGGKATIDRVGCPICTRRWAGTKAGESESSAWGIRGTQYAGRTTIFAGGGQTHDQLWRVRADLQARGRRTTEAVAIPANAKGLVRAFVDVQAARVRWLFAISTGVLALDLRQRKGIADAMLRAARAHLVCAQEQRLARAGRRAAAMRSRRPTRPSAAARRMGCASGRRPATVRSGSTT